MLSKKTLAAIAVVAAAGAAYWQFSLNGDSIEELSFQTQPLTVGRIESIVNTAGTISPVVTVDVGSEVTLVVSKGPKPVIVPEVVGQKKGAAKTAITDAGLSVGEETSVEDDAAANTVIAQEPAAGSEVPAGSAVNLTSSSGPPVVDIPAVKNVPAAEASNLDAATLTQAVRDLFTQTGRDLSGSASVVVDTAGSAWRINDGSKSYTLAQEILKTDGRAAIDAEVTSLVMDLAEHRTLAVPECMARYLPPRE